MSVKKNFDDVKLGERTSFSKTVTETDITLFSGISGDFNPLHLDRKFAEGSIFKERVAHGMLTASFISRVVGEMLGAGGIYLSQSLKFTAPVKIGDTITATAEVVEKLEKGRLRIKTVCSNQESRVVIEGEALGLVPR